MMGHCNISYHGHHAAAAPVSSMFLLVQSPVTCCTSVSLTRTRALLNNGVARILLFLEAIHSLAVCDERLLLQDQRFLCSRPFELLKTLTLADSPAELLQICL
jgi:hypothetical protein